MLKDFIENPYVTTVLAIIAVVSLVYAVFCQHKNKEKKEFSYIQKNHTLIQKKKSKFEKLSVSYDGQAIDNLCISKFTLWNSGNRTLNSTDMVCSKELTISALDENKILDAEIITYSEETNKFSITVIDDHTVKIFFDYVDKKDGIVVQIIHTGTADSLQVSGKIKGGMPIKNIINETAPKFIRKRINPDVFEKVYLIAVGVMVVFILILAIVYTIAIFNSSFQNLLFTPKHTSNKISSVIATSITAWLCGSISSVIYIDLIKRVFNMGVPKSLKKYSNFSN